ncbi:ABC transporter family substrate-binding protein [Pseudonocardia bannensis]|uniref:ABC transporter family substrate-binding protein n=1 Tax=Pseudonocardia bannensis TaxID=630973 RepID=A0A848DLH5_9PSEU|nr:ABC transporter family substrate-binding protein [Pseudonocardia bannensis]NMH93393.1 ABC transporter family substrate-binding protein [Pseudonocardia bannensis]
MGRSHRRVALAAAGAVVALLLAACGGGGGGQLQSTEQQARGAQDINPQNPASLREGGDLRSPLDALPDNLNYNQVDGASGETSQVGAAILPSIFTDGADGSPTLNTYYVTAAEVTSQNPQVVTYQINEQATWRSGRPITWEDFAAQWKALNGTDPAFRPAGTTGYEDIASVERGDTDKQVRVTYARTFAEWQGVFSPLYPKETNTDPAVFNEGWIDKVPDSAGPFQVDTIDTTAQTITLVRNPDWWGERPRLDRVIFRVLDRSALADELANNGIDWYTIGSSVDLYQRARTTPGVVVRQALEKQYNHITFNGAPGSLMEDPAVRRAIAKGIDAQAIANRLVGQIVPNVARQGSHIYPIGAAGYVDNSGIIPFDQAAARAELDRLGWVQQGEARVKDGRELNLRYVSTAGNPISDQISRTVQEQLARIGVRVTIEPVPPAQFFDEAIIPGNFDLTGFQWVTTSIPFSSSKSLYARPGERTSQNFGSIYSQEIEDKYNQGLAELDPVKRQQLGDEIDKLIWQEVHHLPLYPSTGAYAVKENLANWGAKGLGDWDYVRVGFTQ